ncbi:unnamed protein product [Hanseniaspora opuntiae]
MFKSRTINKNIKSISNNEDNFINSKSYESDLIFTFNSPINDNDVFFNKHNLTKLPRDSAALSYSIPTNTFIKRERNYNIDADAQSQGTIEIGSFSSNMTQEIPSTLMMNVNDPPAYENVIESKVILLTKIQAYNKR